MFKSLIIVHFMIREGEPNVTLRYLASGPERRLAVSSFTEGTYTRTKFDGYMRRKHSLLMRGASRKDGAAGLAELDIEPAISAEPVRIKLIEASAVQVQGKNIIAYAEYLVSRAAAYGATKVDYVRAGEGRLKKLSVDKGLLRETESVQDQIRALLKCDVSIPTGLSYTTPRPNHVTPPLP